MLKILIISILFVGLSFLLMSIRLLIIKGGKFPDTSVSGNRELRKRGISCAKCEEMARYRQKKNGIHLSPDELKFTGK